MLSLNVCYLTLVCVAAVLGESTRSGERTNARGEGEGKRGENSLPGNWALFPPPPISHLTAVMSLKRKNVKHIKLELTKINPHGTKMYLTLAVKGEEEKQKKKT